MNNAHDVTGGAIVNTEPHLIGQRIKEQRHYRGMSLRTLAGLSGLTAGFLSRVERGERILDRRSHLAAVADALQVSVTELVGQPLAPVDSTHASALGSIPAIRAALVDVAFGAEHEPTRTLSQLDAAVRDVTRFRADCDYASMGRVLPDLMRDLHATALAGDEPTRTAALQGLVNATYCATYQLKYLGFTDLSMRASDLCFDAAERLGDPVWSGVADFTRLHSLPADSRDVVTQMAVEAAERLEPHSGNEDAARVRGMLHLTAALSSAVADRPSAVDTHLGEAADLAGHVEDGPGFAAMWFGPTNLAFWRVAIAVEMGEGGRVVELSDGVRPDLVGSTSRQAAFFSDLGRGLAQTRRHDDRAVAVLARAETLAPQRVRTNPAVRETVANILRRARREAGGRPLRGLAHRCGVA